VSRPPAAERRSLLPYVLLTIVVAIWASNTIATKLLLREVSPSLLTLVRFSMAALAFHLPLFLVMQRRAAPFRRREWLLLAGMGVIGQAASTLFFNFGVSMTPATYAALMMMTAPVWGALLALIFLGERLGLARGLGMATSFLGAAILATEGQVEAPDADILLGSVLLTLCQISWASYTLIGKPLIARRHPLLVLAGANLIAFVALWLATGLVGGWAELPQVLTWSATTWALMLYLVLLTSTLSQVMYIYALRDVSAAQAISFMYLQPVFTALMAAAVLGEELTLLTLVCGALILFGLWLVNRPRPPRSPASDKV
jgi:drug/metabolite transporter (DMT)-like permease